MADTQPRVKSTTKSRLQLVSDNILYNNGIITAFYLMPTINYTTASSDGITRAIRGVTNLIAGIASQRSELIFTIERVDKTISSLDVRNNLLNTIKLYRQDYNMPPEFSDNIKDDSQSYSLLCIDIKQKELLDVEELSIRETAKELFNVFVANMSGLGNLNLDVQKVLDIEKNIFSTIRHKCVRASRELVFYNYVSKVYPCYNISYDRISFINEDNYESIMGSITQTVSDNFGMFEMHNDGVDIFDMPIQTTYGCMLDIKSFPPKIATYNFPMDYPGCVTTVKTLKKDNAKLKLKRVRSSDRYELKQAAEVGAEDEALEETSSSIQVATRAISEIDAGETVCEFNCSILVTGLSKEDLKRKTSKIIADCKDRNILVSKSLNQATDFLDQYINMRPKKFSHFANLQFPLSFQQNNGSIVGDSGSGMFTPSIGEDIN